jgi:hypothetical protein
MGLSLGTAGATVAEQEHGKITGARHPASRPRHGCDVSRGRRYPILNASFAPVFNTPAISSVIQNNRFQAFPSFNYEDIGLSVRKAKPRVNGSSDVSLDLEIQFRALSGSRLTVCR